MPRVVKGSRQQRMTVVPYRPWQRILLLAGFLVLVVVLAISAYQFGLHQGARMQKAAEASDPSAPQQLAQLQMDLSVLERTRQLDQEANVQAQAAIAQLRSQVATLERDVALYRQVMAVEADEPGLSVQQWALYPTELPDHYRYRLVLAHTGTEGATLVGTLWLTVDGDYEGSNVVVSEKASGTAFSQPVSMRYLQIFEGDLVLPDGLRPEHVILRFDDASAAGLQLNESLPWQPEED